MFGTVSGDQQDGQPRGSNFRLLVSLVLAILAPIIPGLLLLSGRQTWGTFTDLPEFYVAARMLWQGQGSYIYNLAVLGTEQNRLFPELGGRVIGLFVPPPAVPLLLPLGLVPVKAVETAWFIFLLAALVAGLMVLKRYLKLTAPEILFVFAVVAASGPAYEGLRLGQLSPVLLLGLSLSLAKLEQDKPALSALALSVLFFKPQELLPLCALLMGVRRLRVLGALAFSALVLGAISWLILGTGGWAGYLDLLSGSVNNSVWMQPELNPTVRGQLLRFFPQAKEAAMVAGVVVCLAALTVIYVCGRRLAGRPDWLKLGLIVAMPLGLVTSLHCHDYDLLLLLPSLLCLVKTGLYAKLPGWAVLACILAVPLYLLPLYSRIHYDYLLKGGVVNPLFWMLLLLSLGALLVAMRPDNRGIRDLNPVPGPDR